MATATRAHSGPVLHVQHDALWRARRGYVLVRETPCWLCKRVIPIGTVVIRSRNNGYVCPWCALTHYQGQSDCPLCVRLRLQGPKCQACGGVGYGEVG